MPVHQRKAMSNDEILDYFRELYGGRPAEPTLGRDDTALLCIDFQYVDAHPDYGVGATAKRLGLAEVLEPYFTRVETVVIPNARRLQALARAKGMEVIHVRVASATEDGRDGTRRYKRGIRGESGFAGRRDATESQILPGVGPEGDELVVSKLTSSVFNSTTIDFQLRNMGIRNLIIVGMVTNGCVESTARSASDLGYDNILVEDATAALVPELHEQAILGMSIHRDAVMKSTSEVLAMMEAL